MREESEWEGFDISDEEWDTETRLDSPDDEPVIQVRRGAILRTSPQARKAALEVLKDQIAAIKAMK
jgi:hypothetical protein